jgi:hypothetical protein
LLSYSVSSAVTCWCYAARDVPFDDTFSWYDSDVMWMLDEFMMGWDPNIPALLEVTGKRSVHSHVLKAESECHGKCLYISARTAN